MKVYAVKQGRKTGIFSTWAECEAQIKGYQGAKFKSFVSLDEAKAYLNDKDLFEELVEKDNNEGYLVAFTDGSFEGEISTYSYGAILILPDGSEKELSGKGNDQRYVGSRNIIGEVLGVLSTLSWAKDNGYKKVKIYHDYAGLSKWATGEWATNTETSRMYAEEYSLKYRKELDVVFVKVPGHSNVSYNERVDKLAKAALYEK